MMQRYAPNENGTMWKQKQGAYVKHADAQAAIEQAKAEALEQAIAVLWECVGREEYGHAKAAVTLDIEAIRALAEGGSDAR